MPPKATPRTDGSSGPLRYAHPFFTPVPAETRPKRFSPHGQRMSSWIAQSSGPIPKPRTAASVVELSRVIGSDAVKEIEAAGVLRFHAVGDTGRPDVHNANQEGVTKQMSGDYDVSAASASNPAFFLHLGDVIYGPNKQQMYRDEFYRPYMKYPGKILALPGNHDGEVFATTDPVPLKAFTDNFCARTAKVPPVADQVRIFRQTITQSGVYYRLTTPFADIVALYSNIAEGPGSIIGANNDQAQKTWLTKTLTSIGTERQTKRKALIFAVHHPPFSNGGHAGSSAMLTDLDDACAHAGIQPDAVLSGHAHNYQRHTRSRNGRKIPFIVAGCGGHNDSSVEPATGQQTGDHSYDFSFKGFGYLLITATTKDLKIDFYQLGTTNKPLDSATVKLA
jgi:hypothetical protein